MASLNPVSECDPNPTAGWLTEADGPSARDYIADMAAELSALARSSGEARLAEALGRVAALAREEL